MTRLNMPLTSRPNADINNGRLEPEASSGQSEPNLRQFLKAMTPASAEITNATKLVVSIGNRDPPKHSIGTSE